jgi:hypothetical protein
MTTSSAKHKTRTPRLTALQRRIVEAGEAEIQKAITALLDVYRYLWCKRATKYMRSNLEIRAIDRGVEYALVLNVRQEARVAGLDDFSDSETVEILRKHIHCFFSASLLAETLPPAAVPASPRKRL